MGEIVMYQYVVYERPDDYPDGFVTRRWRIERGGVPPVPDQGWTAASLEGARAWVPEGMVNIGRYPEDDSKIVEVWT